MSFVERLQTTWIDLAATGRVLSEIRKFLPNSHWNIAKLVERNAQELPNHIALRYLEQSFTWRELNERANQYAHAFADRGLRSRDVLALMMDNRPDMIFAQVGASKLNAVVALINTNLADKGLTHAINIGHPKLVLIGSEHAPEAEAVLGDLSVEKNCVLAQRENDEHSVNELTLINDEVERASTREASHGRIPDASDASCYIYTSGTTGLPKAAIITNTRFMMAASFFGNGVHEATPDDTIYVTLPLYHSNAQWAGFGAACMTGCTIALRRKFSASNFWSDVRKFDATRFIYIGELCRYLLNTPPQPDERNHRVKIITGNGMRPDIWEEFQHRFGVPLVREFYGATEGNAPMVNIQGVPGMVGRLRPGQVIVRCDQATGDVIRNAKGFCEKCEEGDTGLLLGRINPVTKYDGYVDKKATSKKVLENVFKNGDQYFNSGDLLTLNADGWVAFADRVGDTFRWKGENVSTNEVAEVLNAYDGVLESNVYGVQVPGKDGRAGMASLNVEKGFSLDGFADFVVTKLPNYQRPFFIRVQDDMRITGTFKHQKVDYRKEGYDPAKVADDRLYFLDGKAYVPIDSGLYEKLQNGEVGPR